MRASREGFVSSIALLDFRYAKSEKEGIKASIPTDCGDLFDVNSSGSTKAEAEANTQVSANKLCKRMKKGCDKAIETGEGTFKGEKGLFVYSSTYVCISV